MSKLPLCAGLLFVLPTSALGSEKFALQSNLDHVWTMTAAGLVFLMQAGFMLLEAGTVRAKNSVNVAQKNLIDFLLSTACFGALGFAVMFGATQGGWFGWSSEIGLFNTPDDWSMTFFVFQLVFCGTAATIVSGAVAERMSMPGYVLITILIATLIYPVVGHWVWGGLLNGQDGPWLADMGFMDFAGGTVVHSVGAWVGLAAIIIIGARRGRFDERGRPIELHGHSPILATVGALVIWVGWIGFNGGSTTAGTSEFAMIIQNTMISGGFGGVAAMFLGWYLAGHLTPLAAINGALAGLVAVTPGCAVLSGQSAMVLGLLAGVLVTGSERMFTRARLDDPLGAISVHGVCGAFGTIMLAVLAPEEALMTGSRGAQIGVQVTGVLAVFAWSFGLAFAVLWTLSKLLSPGGGRSVFRVLENHEVVGLNVAEHNAPLGTGVLQSALAQIAQASDADFTPIEVERGDEAYEMAQLINQIMGGLQRAMTEMETAVSSAAVGDFSHRIDLGQFSGTPKRLCAGMNRINDICGSGVSAIQARLDLLADGDLVSGISEDMQGQFGALRDTLMAATQRLSITLGEIAASADQADDGGRRIAAASSELADFAHAQERSLAGAMPLLEGARDTSVADRQRAADAATNCGRALFRAKSGMGIAEQTMAKMDAVDQAATEIDGAIGQIEAIARQINLLAVNTGIEATRMGGAEDGQSANGFKVLAQEVRTLADHTRQTVHEVREKSALVTTTARDSKEMVEGLQGSLSVILDTMQQTSALSEAVADAGAEQDARLQEIGQAIDDLRAATDQTSALILQSKGDATALAQDADKTARKLSEFDIRPPPGPLSEAA